jgi:hypothetical protein
MTNQIVFVTETLSVFMRLISIKSLDTSWRDMGKLRYISIYSFFGQLYTPTTLPPGEKNSVPTE